MLTIFSTPKPFNSHSDIIQRTALKSWTLLHPDVEVILFGDEEGAAEACRDLGIDHEPHGTSIRLIGTDSCDLLPCSQGGGMGRVGWIISASRVICTTGRCRRS